MFEKYFGALGKQSRDVFGTHAKTSLSIFSLLSVAAVILPLSILILFVVFKIF